MDMTDQHEGGCLCGAIRYAFTGDPLVTGLCHCRHCQRQSGAPFSVVSGVEDARLTVHGTPKTYVDSSDSGHPVYRLFCAECGSPLISRLAAMPGLSFIKAGTLDQPGLWRPAFEVYCERSWPWLPALAEVRYPLSNAGASE